MTELDQYKKAYALLVGRVDTIISNLEHVSKDFAMDHATATFAADALAGALQEAEEVFLAEDSVE